MPLFAPAFARSLLLSSLLLSLSACSEGSSSSPDDGSAAGSSGSSAGKGGASGKAGSGGAGSGGAGQAGAGQAGAGAAGSAGVAGQGGAGQGGAGQGGAGQGGAGQGGAGQGGAGQGGAGGDAGAGGEAGSGGAGQGGSAGGGAGQGGAGMSGSSGQGGAGMSGSSGQAGAAGFCQEQEPIAPATPGPVPTLAPEFSAFYKAYELGPVPGMPAGHLGGCVVKYDDPNTLLLAGNSESPTSALYAIKLKRDGCGHILGFEGTATQVASAPYMDANLAYGKDDVLLYSQYPTNQISQLLPGAQAPALTTDLSPLGVDTSIGGLGFVPPGLDTAGSLRVLSWPGGNWFSLTSTVSGGLYQISAATKVSTLAGGPGGFAYVPKGSKGFAVQSVIVAEWSADTVGVYEVDSLGDPQVATRKSFFSSFPKPWGAYFDPVSGDYLFLTWSSSPDLVYVVRGFVPPPEKP